MTQKVNTANYFWCGLFCEFFLFFHIFYWDCFDVTSVFFSYYFNGMVYKTQTINSFYTVYAVIERVLLKRMNRKTDELEYSFESIDRWRKKKSIWRLCKKKMQSVAQCERKMVVRCSMREIGFEIKWSLLTTAFIPTNI